MIEENLLMKKLLEEDLIVADWIQVLSLDFKASHKIKLQTGEEVSNFLKVQVSIHHNTACVKLKMQRLLANNPQF